MMIMMIIMSMMMIMIMDILTLSRMFVLRDPMAIKTIVSALREISVSYSSFGLEKINFNGDNADIVNDIKITMMTLLMT